jgi:hypothetical protein
MSRTADVVWTRARQVEEPAPSWRAELSQQINRLESAFRTEIQRPEGVWEQRFQAAERVWPGERHGNAPSAAPSACSLPSDGDRRSVKRADRQTVTRSTQPRACFSCGGN